MIVCNDNYVYINKVSQYILLFTVILQKYY